MIYVNINKNNIFSIKKEEGYSMFDLNIKKIVLSNY